MSSITAIELAPTVAPEPGPLPQSVAFQDENPAGVASDERVPLNRRTVIKLLSAGFSFFFAGCNDGSLGTLIPYLLHQYAIGTNFVAALYSASFAGWLVAALTNSYLTHALRLSTYAILILGALLQLAANVIRVCAPPFPLFCVSFFVTCLGMGYQDAHSNTFTATVPGAHRWLGFIHAMYALGLTTGPFVASAIASHSRWNWFYFYTIGVGCINLTMVVMAFRGPLIQHPSSDGSTSTTSRGRRKEALQHFKDTLKLPSVWLLSMFFFFFLGAGFTAGGWVVEYLVKVRKGSLTKMGYVPTGFNGGALLGRIFLAEPTYRFGERRMLAGYAAICIAMQLIFWQVQNIVADAVTFAVLGFFFGPFFPTGISVASKLFPKEHRSSALSFLFALAQAGAAIFPSVTGVIAAHKGVKVLQPVLTALFTATLVAWLLVPKVQKPRE